MAGRPKLIPGVSLHLHLPEDLHARLTVLLWSPTEGRVPKGAYQRFFVEQLTQFFNQKEPPNGSS